MLMLECNRCRRGLEEQGLLYQSPNDIKRLFCLQCFDGFEIKNWDDVLFHWGIFDDKEGLGLMVRPPSILISEIGHDLDEVVMGLYNEDDALIEVGLHDARRDLEALRKVIEETSGARVQWEEFPAMPFLSVREETMDLLNHLRLEGESDADLIDRIVEFSRCYMIARGARARMHGG